MKLDAIKLGLTCGIIWAGGVLFFVLTDVFLGGWGGGLVKSLGTIYLGYKPTASGVLIGMIWAFFDAGIGGWLVAVIYNWLLDLGKK